MIARARPNILHYSQNGLMRLLPGARTTTQIRDIGQGNVGPTAWGALLLTIWRCGVGAVITNIKPRNADAKLMIAYVTLSTIGQACQVPSSAIFASNTHMNSAIRSSEMGAAVTDAAIQLWPGRL
jgi:hypothetical protein